MAVLQHEALSRARELDDTRLHYFLNTCAARARSGEAAKWDNNERRVGERGSERWKRQNVTCTTTHVQTAGCSAIMPVLLSLSSEANWTPTAGRRHRCNPAAASAPPLLCADNVMGAIWNTKDRNRLMDLSEIVTVHQNKSMTKAGGVLPFADARLVHRIRPCRTRRFPFNEIACKCGSAVQQSDRAKLMFLIGKFTDAVSEFVGLVLSAG